MPETLEIKRLDQRPMTESLLVKNKFRVLGLDLDSVIKYFFAGSAWTAIVVLALITVSLFSEGFGFFPQHYESLKLYRMAGLEFVDHFRDQTEASSALGRYLNKVRSDKSEELLKLGRSEEQINLELAALDTLIRDFATAAVPPEELLSEMTTEVAGVKERYSVSEENKKARKQLLDAGMKEEAEAIEIEVVDFATESEKLKAYLPRVREVSTKLADDLKSITTHLPVYKDKDLAHAMSKFEKTLGAFVDRIPGTEKAMEDWNYSKPVPAYQAVTKFLFGTQWVTQSFWQDWYGFLPLLAGSLSISLVAILVAVPLGVGAAIYINQVATTSEQNFIKPFIEFIAVIPSVVLGFFGIAVLGESVRLLTQWDALAWVPGFPISERLNIVTAGLLLALMSVPTIFTFSEDALNNVPKAYKEASFALGANRLQTILRIMVPASLSGIISAVLLGFGRVIGETMVVLLCAGNRIQIPDFTAGLNFVFQPVHTMTGLVAQEIPEVVNGSLQYRALFMLAVILFMISLLVNYVAQIFVRKYKISIG